MHVQGMKEQFCRGGGNELFHALDKGKWALGKGKEEVISEHGLREWRRTLWAG